MHLLEEVIEGDVGGVGGVPRPGGVLGVHKEAAAIGALRGHKATLGQLFQLVPAPCQVPHEMPVKARLLPRHTPALPSHPPILSLTLKPTTSQIS